MKENSSANSFLSWNTFLHISTNEYGQKIFKGVTEHLMINYKIEVFHLFSLNSRKNSMHLEMSLISKKVITELI